MNFFEYIFGKKNGGELTYSTSPKFHVPDFDKYDEFSQIVTVFDYSLNSDFAIADKAAETVDRLFKSGRNIKNKQFYGDFKNLRLKKSDLKKFDRFEKEVEITLLCIVSLNGNGYLREIALNRLIEFQAQRTIPFILFRLADWVAPIRKKADLAIKKFLITENIIYFIQNHKLIDWLLQIERVDLSELYNQIVESIISKHLEHEKLVDLNEGARFFYYKLIAKSGMIDSKLINQMLFDNYYLIRILLIKHLDKVENLKHVLIILLSDKSQKVRQGAVNFIVTQDVNEYEEILSTLIFDNSIFVRAEARRLLSEIKDCDFNKLYKENLLKEQHVIGSILGLSEVSNKSEITFLQKYLDSDIARIRNASFIGVYNLDSIYGIEKAYQILEVENSVKIRRTAESLIAKHSVDYKRLRKLYGLTDSTGKIIILRLFNLHSNWSVAGDFLMALTDKDEKIQLMARVFLESWNNYTIQLATSQSAEDKYYVLSCYKKTKEMGIRVPSDTPFIFGEKLD